MRDPKTYSRLDESDPSFDKLLRLEQALVAASNCRRIQWERATLVYGHEYTLTCPAGVVTVTKEGVRIFNRSGQEERRFRYESDRLYLAVKAAHESASNALIDSLIEDLNRIAKEAKQP